MEEEKIVAENEQQEGNTPEVKPERGIDESTLQAKIDSAVKNRLARERETQRQAQSLWEEERKELTEELEYLRKQVQLTIDQTTSELDDDVKQILSKLNIRDQIEWVNKRKIDLATKKSNILTMPNFNKKDNSDKKEISHSPIDRIA